MVDTVEGVLVDEIVLVDASTVIDVGEVIAEVLLVVNMFVTVVSVADGVVLDVELVVFEVVAVVYV